MPLPTVDEIRERARDLFYARLPPEVRAKAPLPEDYELRETGLWLEAQRELMVGERRRFEEELGRWEKLADPERAELRQRIEAFDVALEDLKRAMEETEAKIKAPPPTIKITPRFTIGERVKHDVHGEGVVRAVRFDEKKKVYEDLVEFGGKKIWLPEPELWTVYVAPPEAIPPLPAVERAPRVAVPRVLRAPPTPKTLEEIIKEFEEKTGVRLERLIHVRVTWPEEVVEPVKLFKEMTPEERTRYENTGEWPTRTRIVERTEVVEVALYGLFYSGSDGRRYEVADYQVVPIPYDKILERVRRAMRPLIRVPRVRGLPTPLEEHYRTIAGIERSSEFKEYVEKEVGMPWGAYLRLDGWSKDAVIKEFASKGLRGLK